MDLDYAHERLMAALKGIADGKGLEDHVPVGGQGIGKTTSIVSALNEALKLDDHFHADHLPAVDRAFKALNLLRPSARKADVAAALLQSMRAQ
jgi:hypothetical protein